MRLNKRRLTGTEFDQLVKALLDAYSLAHFGQMLWVRLEKRLEQLALGDAGDTVFFRVLQRAEDESWTAELLQAARASRPEDAGLLAFAQRFGVAPAVDFVRDPAPPAGETERGRLERQIRATGSMLDVTQWREFLGRLEARVCSIRVPDGAKTEFGTGFLVGPEVVMTNYHVVEKVITDKVAPERVELRFDYKLMADGATLSEGKPYALAEVLDHSRYSPVDEVVGGDWTTITADHLDYALLRVTGAPGGAPIPAGAGAEREAPLRGFVEVPPAPADFAPDASLFILQHPDGRRMKLALDTSAVIGANPDGTRVRYRTHTEGGSSGSPCFDANWNLVALHHAGDPDYSKFHRPEYNQGIPVAAIRALLKARGKEHLLGPGAPADTL
jgi:hypothetical protein